MSNIEPRGTSRPTRKAREQRAYRLVVATGGLGLVAVVGALLAIVGIIGWSVPVIAAILAVVCAILFRRMVRR
jgi:uncharacterized membrane protein